MVIAHEEQNGSHGEVLHSFLPTIDGVSEEDDMDNVLACDIGDAMAMQATLDLREPAACDMMPEPENH